MKNVKRLLAALLATLTLVGLTACGGSKQQEDTTASDDSGDATSTEETYGEGYVLRVGMNCSAAPFGWTQDMTPTVHGPLTAPISMSAATTCRLPA